MLLLEIAAQGVKGVSFPGGSARLRPGYNVVPADGAALRRLLEVLLFPGPGAEALRAAASTGVPRAGVTLVGADGVTYRLVRDLAAGCELHRFDAQKRAFAIASRDLAEIAAQLAGAAGVPTPEQLSWLTLSAAELPSRARAAACSLPPALPARRAMSPEEAEARLQELRDELERAHRAEKLQYQLDGLQTRLFKLEETLKEEAKLREELAATEEAMQATAPVAQVAERLGDLGPKLGAHAKAVAKRDEALVRAEAEKGSIEAAVQQGPPRAFWIDPRFWAGVAAGLGAAAMGFAGGGRGLRYLALLDIPAFGWAAWVALGWVGAREEEGRRARRAKLVDEHERKALEAFERDTAEIREAMKAVGANDVAELQNAFLRLSDHRVAVEAARQRLQAFEARPDTQAVKQEKERVEAALHEAEAALSGTVGGYLRDPRSIEQDIQRLSEPDDGEHASALAAPASADPIRDLLERAGQELGGTPAGAVRTVQASASQALKALSGNRLTGVGVDDRGNLLVQAAARTTAAAQLPPPDRDLAFFALKLAFLEAALAPGQGFALIEDAFGGLPEAARRQVGRILKQLARPAQVLHATADIAFRESADNAA